MANPIAIKTRARLPALRGALKWHLLYNLTPDTVSQLYKNGMISRIQLPLWQPILDGHATCQVMHVMDIF